MDGIWGRNGQHTLLIPVPRNKPEDVKGIQPTRVCAARESFQPKELGWLDSCDEHRNEGSASYPL